RWVSDWSSDVCSSDLAARRALARWCHHVVAVRGRTVAADLGIDARSARAGMLEFLEHQHAGAAGDHEAVAAEVIGARGLVGRVEIGRASCRERGERAV